MTAEFEERLTWNPDDVIVGKEKDVKKALKEKGYTFVPARPQPEEKEGAE